MPSLKHIYPSFVSLQQIPALRRCPKILVFDGVSPDYSDRLDEYNYYKDTLVSLAQRDPVFSRTTFVYCDRWVHLSGALRTAISNVITPFVFIHQHDDILRREFDLEGCIATMTNNANVKHIHLTRYINKGWAAGDMQSSWDGPVDEEVDGPSSVPLTRCFGWSDYSHLATTEYWREFVLPQCAHGFPESFVHRQYKADLLGKTGADVCDVHRVYGTYLYGPPSDGRYIQHTSGRLDGRSVST